MKRAATEEVDSIQAELVEHLLGKVFVANDSRTTAPRFCQVLGWSKNAAKANAKVRYIYAKEISTLELDPTVDGAQRFPLPIIGKAMIDAKEVEKTPSQPIHSLDKKRPKIFQCILRRELDEENACSYSLDRRFKCDKATCAIIEIGAIYSLHDEWEVLKDKVFVYYDD